MTSITVYASMRCSSCREFVPVIKRMAKRKGIAVTVVDVEKCGRRCDSIKLVPTVMLDNKKVSLKQLSKMLKE